MGEQAPPDDRLLAIRRLAAWAPRLRAREEASVTNCAVLKHLVDAGRRHGAQATAEFDAAVLKSAKALSPLGEPSVTVDFTEHRWMAGHREEAYSDWLQWILAQCEPRDVLRVFGVVDPAMVSASAGCAVSITRESRVPEGHEGSSGRLDLEIQLGGDVLLVVEVKLGEAESADTEKGAGYYRSIEAAHPDCQFREYVILVIGAADIVYFKFRPRLWADACIELRVIVARLCARSEHLKAAMTLAFVAAVEQNLLRLRRAHGGAAALTLPPMTEHITRFLEALEDGKKNWP